MRIQMTRDRRLVVVFAGLLAVICANLHPISRALGIPEVALLIAVAIAEVGLFVQLYRISRRSSCCAITAKPAQPGQ